MRKERATLKVSAIIANEGQLPWLPANPRQWTQTDIDRTRNSILEDPDFLEDRPLLVVPMPDGKTWLVFAGNLRREGAKSGKVKEVPCVIYYPETEEDHLTIKRRAMKDNGSFGEWNFDALANEWDDNPLQDWGVPSWEPDPEKVWTMMIPQMPPPGKQSLGHYSSQICPKRQKKRGSATVSQKMRWKDIQVPSRTTKTGTMF